MTEPQSTALDPIRLASWSIFLAVLFTTLNLGKAFLIPLAIAVLLWVLIDWIRDFISGLFPNTSLPHSVKTTLAIVVILFANTLMINIVLIQMEQLNEVTSIYQNRFTLLFDNTMEKLGLDALPSVETLLQQVNFGAILSWFGDSVSIVMTDIVLTAVYLGFLLAEENSMRLKIQRFSADPDDATRISGIATDISDRIKAYLGVKTMVSLVTALLSYGVLSLVGTELAALWSLLVFLLNFIPNIGSLIGIIFPALISLLQFDTITPFLIVVFGLGTINFVIGNVIEPNLMGKSLNISSLMLLLSLAFWSSVWGLAGMFLAVPLMVMIGLICAHVRDLQWFAILLSGDGQIITDR